MKNSLLLLFSIANFFICAGQNGKIISEEQVVQPDSVKNFRIKRIPEFKEIFEKTKLSTIKYLSEGLKIEGFVAQPIVEGKYPCIIFCRGGGGELSKIDWWDTTVFSQLASKGYVVIASQYCGTSGSEGKDEFGGKDVLDVINLIPTLANIPSADTSRIGMLGVSRGSIMIYKSLQTLTNIKAAVINSGGPDLFDAFNRKDGAEWDSYYAKTIPDYSKNKDLALQERSATFWPEKICKTTPLLILHGTSDWRISIDANLKFVDKLVKLKHPVRFVMYEGGVHVLKNANPTKDIMIMDFFDKYLKNNSLLPNMELNGK